MINNWITDDKYWATHIKEEQSPKPTLSVLAQQTLESLALLNRTDHGNQSTYPIDIDTLRHKKTQELPPVYNSEVSSELDGEGEDDDGFWTRE